MAAPQSQAATSPDASTAKIIHSLVLDTGPLIKNDPTVSGLLAKAERLYTLPVILSEIRDTATRSRVETTLRPFITVRSPKPESVKFVAEFSKKTGDFSVLSRPDIEVLALVYELECERNGGDWRLRKTPGQEGLNGKLLVKQSDPVADAACLHARDGPAMDSEMEKLSLHTPSMAGDSTEHQRREGHSTAREDKIEEDDTDHGAARADGNLVAERENKICNPIDMNRDEHNDEQRLLEDGDDDDEGWITPSNLKKHQHKDSGSSGINPAPQQCLQAAILTSDYAMQNVALRINLNLITPSFARITHLKNWVLRCHGCFAICKDMGKQFCPKCGQQTLTRVSCSTDEHGHFTLHLKQNFQWNNRGNKYSVPKPVHGSSNGRLPKNVGGKNNWGKGLILAEDQKEYIKQQDEQRRQRKKDLIDDDSLPGLLVGNRHGAGSKIRVGAGRSVNSRRKR